MEFQKDKLQLRLYQQTILNTTTQKNTLVVLPTGLGKTFIAVALAGLRLKPDCKILVLAPTKPLVAQHMKVFKEFFSPEEEIALFSGEVKPEEREEIWDNSKIIFSTPQTIRNDLISGRISLENISLLVFDEAHRAVGDYAYVFLAKMYVKQARDAKILGLTASPGADEEKINEIRDNLFIEALEARDREHKEVKSYVKSIITQHLLIDLPEGINKIRKRLDSAINSRLNELKRLGFIQLLDNKKITKKALLALQKNLITQIPHTIDKQHKFTRARALSLCAALIKLQHSLSLLESESLGAVKNYFENLWNLSKTSKVRAVKDIVGDFQVRAAYALIEDALKKGVEHPKIETLKNIVEKQIKTKQDSKILVFTEFRTNIPKIIETLEEINNLEVHKFIGQAHRAGRGMSQKTQIETIERFSKAEINCLVCTAVAEEGLDIPVVDLIVFYTPIPSAIRNIQRKGRTGRQEIGKIIILVTKDTKDEAYYWSSKYKENQMRRLVQSMQEDKTKSTLEKYFVKTEKEKPAEKLTVFADIRERGPVVDDLCELGITVNTATLKTGDFIISEDVGAERKTIEDFISSLIDGRLFDQARNLKENFTKPIYILEGNFEDIFKVRNVHSSAIWAALISIMVDWQIPILLSSSPKETAEIISIIAKREQIEKSKIVSLRGSHKPKTLSEQQEYFVEGLPNVGGSLARNLLRHFSSPKKFVNATLDELKKVGKIGEKKAEQIRKVLDSDYIN